MPSLLPSGKSLPALLKPMFGADITFLLPTLAAINSVRWCHKQAAFA